MSRVPEAVPSVAEIAADKLWKHQLRKENKVILEQLEEMERKKKSTLEENERRFRAGEEKMMKLESRIKSIEREQLKTEEALEIFMNEQASQAAEIRRHLNAFLQDRGKITEETDETINITMENISSSAATKQPSVPSKTVASALNKSFHHPRPVHLPNSPDRERSPQITSKGFTQASDLATRSTATNTRNSRRLDTHSRSNSIERTVSLDDPAKISHVAQIPRLHQGTSQMKQYQESANTILASLGDMTEAAETDFVNAFIKGITIPKIKERLVEQLQQVHPARLKKGGIVEILCGWEELVEFMKKHGLLALRGNDISRKKRVQNPRGLIETGFM